MAPPWAARRPTSSRSTTTCRRCRNKGKLVSLATSSDRTLFFDFLPLEAMSIKGFKTKFQLYTVPGQVIYNTTRQLVLRGVDGIVFVADSQYEKMAENVESFANLEENLQALKLNLADIPYVLQYNKRDLPNVAPVEYMEFLLNNRDVQVPSFTLCAHKCEGVFETLNMITRLLLQQVHHRRQPQGARLCLAASTHRRRRPGDQCGVAGFPGEERSHGGLDCGRRRVPHLPARESSQFDATTLSALAANAFSATQAIASLLNEAGFSTVYQQGLQSSILVGQLNRQNTLIVVFPASTPVGRRQILRRLRDPGHRRPTEQSSGARPRPGAGPRHAEHG